MKQITKLFLIISVLVLGTGMSYFQNDNAVSNSDNLSEKAHKHQTRTVKPHAPIFLDYELPLVEQGVAIELPLTITSGKKADDLMIRYMTKHDALQLVNPDLDVHLGQQKKNQQNTHVLEFVAIQDGEYLILLSATAVKNDRTESRSFVIPIRVGNSVKQKQLAPAGKIMQDSDGRPIISMPAVETTK